MNKGNKLTTIRKVILGVDVGNRETAEITPRKLTQTGLIDFQPRVSVEPGETHNLQLSFYDFEHVLRQRVHCKVTVVDTRNKKVSKQFEA